MSQKQSIQVGNQTFYQGGRRSVGEWETASKELFDQGQIFLAYDLAQTGLGQFPESVKLKLVLAMALTRTGALDEARQLLEGMSQRHRPDDDTLRKLTSALRKMMTALGREDATSASEETLALLSTLFRDFGSVFEKMGTGEAPDEDTLALLGRVHKDLWKTTGLREHLAKSRDVYLSAFRTTKGYYSAVNAAAMSMLLGEVTTATALAEETLAVCDDKEAKARKAAEDARKHAQPGLDEELFRADYWLQATRGEAQLLLGRRDDAVATYRAAASHPGLPPQSIVSSLQQLHLLADHGFAVPAQLFDILAPPTIVVFAGHMIDQPKRQVPRFPPEREADVSARIEDALTKLGARIGYCSAANGSDLLFIEAMARRGAEVNILLPFAQEDFVKTSVARPDTRWETRFRNALRLAHSVRLATEERYLNSEALFSFGNKVMRGMAELRASAMETAPYLLAVYDGKDLGAAGGTAEFVREWKDPDRYREIRLEPQDGVSIPPSIPMEQTLTHLKVRSIKAMLFADIVGYSKLPEDRMPEFIDRFLTKVASQLGREEVPTPQFVNTWGDAIFAVLDDPIEMMEYAFALRQVVCETDWIEQGFGVKLNIRTALHAGPVYAGFDPIAKRENYYGAHVNRAARMEPVTVPGCIYASEQFVSYLIANYLSKHPSARRKRGAFELPYHCQYLGTLKLAKDFGDQPVYHMRRRDERTV